MPGETLTKMTEHRHKMSFLPSLLERSVQLSLNIHYSTVYLPTAIGLRGDIPGQVGYSLYMLNIHQTRGEHL